MKTVSFCTLGCKVNQYETEAMLTLFKGRGYETKSFDEVCDIYIINTCVVTSEAERKSRQMIGRAKKKNADALVVVVGCYSQMAPDKVSTLGYADIIIGTKDRAKVVDLCEEKLKEAPPVVCVGNILKERSYENLEISSYEDRARPRAGPRRCPRNS